MSTMLEKEYEYYQSHRDELLTKYEGKFIVIVGEAVLGAFDTREEAIIETQKDHKVGTFLVQQVSSDTENEVMRFHSRVSFAFNAK